MKITGAVLEEIGRARPFAESAPISVSEVELDPPGPDEVLVRIEAALMKSSSTRLRAPVASRIP